MGGRIFKMGVLSRHYGMCAGMVTYDVLNGYCSRVEHMQVSGGFLNLLHTVHAFVPTNACYTHTHSHTHTHTVALSLKSMKNHTQGKNECV